MFIIDLIKEMLIRDMVAESVKKLREDLHNQGFDTTTYCPPEEMLIDLVYKVDTKDQCIFAIKRRPKAKGWIGLLFSELIRQVAVDAHPPDSTMIKQWQQNRITPAEVEKKYKIKNKYSCIWAEFPNKEWERLKSKITSGDVLWEFVHAHPEKWWRNVCGRKGIALVRKGKVVDIILIRCVME